MQIGRNIYTNFDPNQLKPDQQRIVRSLIMGSCGSGKTYFINNLCNTKHTVKNDRGSVTRDIVFQDVVYVEKGAFRIYDTPGTDSSQQALHHALVLRASLTHIPLNLIMINVKLDNRYQKSINQVRGLLKILKMYKQIVVILISHLDILDKDSQKKQLIKQLFKNLKQLKLQFKTIIYSNRNSDIQKISSVLFDIGRCKPPQFIEIDDKTFYKYFNLSCPTNKILQQEIDQYLQEIKDCAEVIIKFVRPLNIATTPDINQLLTYLKLFTKYKLKKIQWEQYQRYSTTYEDQFMTTDIFLMISQYIQTKLEQLDQLCQKKTTKNIYDLYHKKQVNIRQLFKKCPNPQCGLIWMRVAGCGQDTTCGYKAKYYDYERVRDLQAYDFDIVGDQLIPKKKSVKKISQIIKDKNMTQNQFFNFDQNTIETKIGCNGLIQWAKLPLIDNIDQKLKQMFGVSNVEQIQLQFTQLKKKHSSLQQNLNKKVDQSLTALKKDNLVLEKNKINPQLLQEQEKIQKIKKQQ